ncbi:hypothetical protein M3Y98_01226200 [Aphelenchoides besseyi]|nr:hypothetical protein M3Y98_01226200 [Aphelenchoides besseyi]KAI6193390.1 hypothetical protein M3Y96_01012800 [Aphelenchoides besseyi]
MSTDCFAVNLLINENTFQSNGRSAEGQWILLFHRYASFVICASGFLLNVLLISIITKCRSDMLKMRRVFLATSIFDLLTCLTTLMVKPYTSGGFGRISTFSNNFFSLGGRAWETTISIVCATNLLINWTSVPVVFMYRMHLVQHGDHPRGFRLFVYATISIGLAVAYWLCSIPAVYFANINDWEYRKESAQILRFAGYEVEPDRIFGATVENLDLKIVSAGFPILMLVSYSIVIGCSLKIRNFLRTHVVSTAARRQHTEMTRVLVLNAILPLLGNILPSAYLNRAMFACEIYPKAELISSLSMQLVLVVYPVISIYLVKPYRSAFLRLVGLRRLKRHSSIQFDTSSRIGADRARVFTTNIPPRIRAISSAQMIIH